MSVTLMGSVFSCNMPELKTDDDKTVPDTTAKMTLLALADNANEDGLGAYPGVDTLCRKTNFSTSTVCNALNALRTHGFIELVGKSPRDTNNYTISVSKIMEFQWPKFQPQKPSDSSHRNATVSTTETNPSLTVLEPSSDDFKTKKGDVIDGMLHYGKSHESTDAFERAGHYNSLPWGSKSPWPQFERWVVKESSAHGPEIWERYFRWQRGDGKFVAMSPAKIRQNPQAFMDCWPAFRESILEPAPELVADEPYVKPASVPMPDYIRRRGQ